jgi:Protein of unknown function (DUF4239)
MMHQMLVAAAIFLCLVAASLGSLVVSDRLPARYRQDDTQNIVRLAANIFVVTTSLVLGLLFNSARNTFEAVDRNVHAFATDLILLDRSLRHYGPEASDVRQRLAAYIQQAVAGTWAADGSSVLDDRVAELLLDDVENALAAIRPSDLGRAELWLEAQVNLQNVVKRRWALIGESGGTVPAAFLVMLVAWLVLIFASFGYRAPQNAVVVTTFVVAASLIAGSIYLILDMDVPFSGSIQISPAPLQWAEEQLRR